MRQQRGGYSLIEMMVVIGVMAVLTIVSLPQFNQMGERDTLQNEAEEVRQLILEARSQAMAPPGKVSGSNSYNVFEIVMQQGISRQTGDGKYPVVFNKVSCNTVTEVRHLEFPEGVKIALFDPAAVSGVATVPFALANVSQSCPDRGQVATVEPGAAAILSIKLTNEHLKVKRDGNLVPEYMFINVNRYSGQVWVGSEASYQSGSLALPPDRSDYDSDYEPGAVTDPVQDTYLDSASSEQCQQHGIAVKDGTGQVTAANDLIKVQGTLTGWSKAGLIKFSLSSVPAGTTPKRARLWLTAGSGTGTGKVSAYLLSEAAVNAIKGEAARGERFEAAAVYGGAACPGAGWLPVGNLYDSAKKVGEISGITANKSYTMEFAIGQYLTKLGNGQYDFSQPLYLALIPESAAEMVFYSSERKGMVTISDSTGGERRVRPLPYLELIWW